MNLRRTLLLHVWLQTALWIAIAVVVNHAASARFLRVDLTEDQAYTLSPTARDVMRRLERPLVARMYFTGGLEAPYNNHRATVQEALEELRAYSNGRMEIVVIDPDSPADVEEAQRFGIQPIQYRYRSRERAELKQVFMGVSFVYGDRQEVVDPITNLAVLEYELVRAVHTLTTPAEDRKVVAYLQGNGEPDLTQFPPDNPMGQLRDRLAQQYTLRPLVLGGDTGVPEDVDAVLVVGPQQAVPDRVQYQLDQYLMTGGPIAFFLSSLKPDFQTMRAAEVRHGLNAFLGHHGVQVNKDALVDRKHNTVMKVPVMAGKRRQLVPVDYPLIPTTTDLNRESPVVRGLDLATLPFASTLSVADPLPAGVTAQVWVRSMPGSGAIDALRWIRPDAFQVRAPGERDGPFPVAVGLVGRFTSFFADRPIPPAPAAADGSVRRDDPTEKVLDGEESRIVVVSSADFVANNLPFVLNTVDWMVQDDALIRIRSRSTTVDLLPPPEPDAAWRWKAAIALGPLALLLGFGGLVWARTRRAA